MRRGSERAGRVQELAVVGALACMRSGDWRSVSSERVLQFSSAASCVGVQRGGRSRRAAFRIGGGEYFEKYLAVAVSAGPADVARQVHAIAAVGAAHGWRCGREWRFFIQWVFAIQATAAAGDRANDAAAHIEVRGNLPLREFSVAHEAVDFMDKCGGKHGGMSDLRCEIEDLKKKVYR